MNWNRIKYILLYAWYHMSHSLETWIDLFWFTIVSLVVFGIIAHFMTGENSIAGQGLLLGYLMWEVVRISQYCITVGVMWEVWSKCFSTLFVSPIKMSEFLTGHILSGVLKTVSVIVLLSIFSGVFFGFNVLVLGWWLPLYILILMIFGFGFGIFITGLILRYNTDIQSLAWGLIYVLQPFSAIFYPLDVLPEQIRWFSYLSPITYIMESARHQLAFGTPKLDFILYSSLLTAAYFIGSALFLRRLFAWSKQTGAFSRLGN